MHSRLRCEKSGSRNVLYFLKVSTLFPILFFQEVEEKSHLSVSLCNCSAIIHSRTILLSRCPAIKEWELPEYIQNPSIMGLDLGTFTLCGVSTPRTWWGHNFKEELFPVAVALMLEVNSLTPGCGAQFWSLKFYGDKGRMPAKACSVNPKRSTFYSETTLNPGHTVLCFDECPISLPICFFLQLLYS